LTHESLKCYKFGSTKDNCSFALVPKNHLENINTPSDLKRLQVEDLDDLASELRSFIIDVVSTKMGHLGASLGVVELTIALHYVFDTPDDLLVWDVGHQAYPHKILTGRREVFHTNRQLNGISGFPSRDESPYDPFGTGHSSTSISAVLGMAIASRRKGNTKRQHIAVIGDASIASGMAFEGLNHAGVADSNILIVLNDNEMGIDPNVGALKNYLTAVKKGQDDHQKNIFEALDLTYSGPVDGHDVRALIEELERLKDIRGPKILHVITKKGKGLKQAEKDQITYHSPGRFDKESGDLLRSDETNLPPKFQDVFGLSLVELAEQNQAIVGVTPAMPTGSSMKFMIERFPERAFDVGIAEQHAVTLCAGLATQGMIPFCAIYSTFLQRAYDQIIHDVALQRLPVIFCIDRAGLVGEDGATHHGVFDLVYLSCIPNMSILAPMDEIELRNAMFTAQLGLEGPLAIRYPRGRGEMVDWNKPFEELPLGKSRQLRKGSRIAILSLGTIGSKVKNVLDEIEGAAFSHIDMRYMKPLDEECLNEIFEQHELIVTVEEGVLRGGFGSAVLEYADEKGLQIPMKRIGLGDAFIGHGSAEELEHLAGLDESSLKQEFEFLLSNLKSSISKT
jgi:1-deoxy-D-xylulose-5-phosphate synthase